MRKDFIPRKYSVVFLILTLLLFSAVKAQAQTNEDCLTCHSDKDLKKEKNGKEISLFMDESILLKSTHSKLSCVSCHVKFNPDELPHKEKIEPIDCKMCHKDAVAKHTFHPQMAKKGGNFASADVSCKQCHGTHDVSSPKRNGAKFGLLNLAESCGKCHQDEKAKYKLSAHFRAFENKVNGAPNCLSCHKTSVAAKNSPLSPIQLKTAQNNLCSGCHKDDKEIRRRTLPSAGFITSYEKSVHGQALKNGNAKAAGCIDCHSPHDVKNASDPDSRINRINIPDNCGKCHQSVASEYKQSIHGVSAAKGNAEAPVCTNCHGDHAILKHNDPNAPVSYSNVASQVCTPCHSSVTLTAKYGLPQNKVSTYEDSYHGLALKGGALTVANCASCHGAHNIKPSSDSTSSTNKKNLVKTCGKCHPGANKKFAEGNIHLTITEKQQPVLYWLSTGYIIMIIVIIGGMFIHNIFDFLKKSRRKILIRRGMLTEERRGTGLYLRMTVSERIQHISMMLSFMTLVITGFMLRFPDAWWVSAIRNFSPNLFEIRSIIHRVAAVVMVIDCLYHLFYLLFTSRGRRLLVDIFPRRSDIYDAFKVLKYNFGFSKTKPEFGRFSYIEKSEYWALVWGTVVMSVTGMFMWFDNTFLGIWGKDGYDIVRTIHYFEAWLAFLAIVVWHIYFVIFNPDMYPMNLAWITGKLSESEMEEEHPKELRMIKEQQLKEREKKDEEKTS
jgi:formate dehydrogenase gamma subunit